MKFFLILDLIKENKNKFESFEYNLTKAIIEAENNFGTLNCAKNEIIIACGSFFIMKEVRESLGYVDEVDPFEMNELSTNLKFGK